MVNGTLHREVAQMVMPRLDGARLGDSRYLPYVRDLVQQGIGGFILFGGTVSSTPAQLREIQKLSSIPLLIASDVERGLGQQLDGGTRFPSQRAVAEAVHRAADDAQLLDRMLDAVRLESRAAGIHIVFSPVVDVNNNPNNPIICTRAFGDEPSVVSWFGSRYISRLQHPDSDGYLSLLACAKHFPGHGDTDQDSHSVLPVIRADKVRLNAVELLPFRQAVSDGVGTVMVAHLLVRALDADTPTTFSRKIVTALLREEMGFEGLIFSDALDMGALTGLYSAEELAVRTVESGMDVLLHPADAQATILAVVAAVESGRISRERIRQSVGRIDAAKRRLGLYDNRDGADMPIDYRAHAQLSDALCRKAVKIVRGETSCCLPIQKESGIACFILDDDNGTDTGNVFLHAMRERFQNISTLVLTPGSDMPDSLVQDCIKPADVLAIAVFSRIAASKGRSGLTARMYERIKKMLAMARDCGVVSLLVSFDSPYLLEQFHEADLLIAGYDSLSAIQTAVADLLATGHL